MKVGKMKIKAKGGTFNSDQFIKRSGIEPKAESQDLSFGTVSLGAEYKDRYASLSFEALKEIAVKVAPIGAIIGTRVDQVGNFTSRARYSDKNIGFRVKLRDRTTTPTEEQEHEIKRIEDFIYQCGFTKDHSRDNFDTFIRKTVRDSLICDQMNFEITRDSQGKLNAFYAVDAQTIKPVSDDDREDDTAFVQVVAGKVVASFTDREMAFAVRNPRTDVNLQPYGLSEIELIVRQLTSYMEAEEYNMRFFKQGGMTKGILNIKEDPSGLGNRNTLESFKRQWRTQVTGQKGAWKIPVFQLPGELEFINIQQSGGEMVFEKWVNYLINIATAVYKIDPAEINFPNNGGVGGKGSSLFSGEEGKYNQSKDKGLYPLLQFIENTINKYIVSEFSDDYVFVFEGVNEKSEEAKLDIDKKRVETFMTVNEIRAERGLEPIEGGDIVENPYFMQSKMQSGGGEGDDGFDFDFGDDDIEKSITIETF